MTTIRQSLLSPAMIVACAALIVALGGVSYAAGVLPQNSVGRAQLKKNAVTGSKIRNGSLLAADFKAGQLSAGRRGSKGDPGPQGPQGDKGVTGSPGISGYETVDGATKTVAPGQIDSTTVSCPTGKKVLGGGGAVGAAFRIIASRPLAGNQWWFQAKNEGALLTTMQAFAICAKVD